jgi:thiol:disulfide interchange protein DsbC
MPVKSAMSNLLKPAARRFCLALLAVVALNACAADADGVPPAAAKAVQDALAGFAPHVKVDAIRPAPIPGYYQVIASGQMVYVSTDGKYMFSGNLVDLTTKKDLNEADWAAFRKAELAKVPPSQRIVFAPAGKPVHTVTVFTDVTCGYCRELHRHIEELNKQGIAVQYLPWPREGVVTTAGRDTPTYTEMVSVWCAADRKSAFTAAIIDGHQPKAATCPNTVKDEFDLGLKLGVSGTPTVVAEDGTVIGGYLDPAQMRHVLDQLAAKQGG